MSLQVWLPLNGNLKNNGINPNIKFTGSSTFDLGKYGKCKTTGTITATNDITTLEGFAFSFWWKINEGDTYSISLPVNTGVSGGENKALTFNKINYSDSTPPHQAIKLAATQNLPQMLWVRDKRHENGTWALGEWNHFTVNFLYKDGKMTVNIYTNGIKTNVYNSTTYNINLCAGKISISGTAHMQDFRLYDHSLSETEIERDYCSLLIHYPLRDSYIENTTNILSDGKFPSFSKLTLAVSDYVTNDGVSVLTTGAHTSTTGSVRVHIPLNKLVNNTAYTLTFKWRLKSGQGSLRVGDWCDKTVTRKKEYFNGSYWEYEVYLPAREYTSTYRFIDFNNVGAESVYEIWDVQIEAKDHATAFTIGARQNEKIYDCSGRGHHSIDRGNLTIVPDGKRNSYYTHFEENNSIKIPSPYGENTYQMTDFSVAMWIKLTNAESSLKSIFTTRYGKNSAGQAGWISINTEGKTLWFYNTKYHGAGSTMMAAEEWHHIVVTYKNGSAQWYLDGAALGSPISDTIGYVNAYDSFSLGDAYTENTTASWAGTPFTGDISDFRFYGIAIPASAVKDLYNNSATIDNQGNIHCFEFMEV